MFTDEYRILLVFIQASLNKKTEKTQMRKSHTCSIDTEIFNLIIIDNLPQIMPYSDEKRGTQNMKPQGMVLGMEV